MLVIGGNHLISQTGWNRCNLALSLGCTAQWPAGSPSELGLGWACWVTQFWWLEALRAPHSFYGGHVRLVADTYVAFE